MANHQHKDEENTGKCSICQVDMCASQKQEGARNLMCSRIAGHKGEHYDKRQKVHF